MSLASQILSRIGKGWCPVLQFVRYRRPNIQRPRIPHYEKAMMLKITKPLYPNVAKYANPEEICQKLPQYRRILDKEREITTYEKILAKEVRDAFDASKMIGFFHLNSIPAEEMRKAKVLFLKNSMVLDHKGKRIMKIALEDKYEAILPLYETHCVYVTSETIDTPKLLQLSKKIPQIILMGAVVENRLMSVEEVIAHSKLPSLDMMRARLCQTLSTATTTLQQSLLHHPVTLSSSLTRIGET